MKSKLILCLIIILLILIVYLLHYKNYKYNFCNEHDYLSLKNIIKTHNQIKNIGLQNKYISYKTCLLYTYPSPRDRQKYRMPSSA